MSPYWLTTHGVGTIKDTASGFGIKSDGGSARITPPGANELEGWVHFAIPGPVPDTPKFQKLRVDFSSQSATITAVNLHLGNYPLVNEEQLQETSSFQIDDITPKRSYGNVGISLSIKIKFEGTGSSITVQSVGVYASN